LPQRLVSNLHRMAETRFGCSPVFPLFPVETRRDGYYDTALESNHEHPRLSCCASFALIARHIQVIGARSSRSAQRPGARRGISSPPPLHVFPRPYIQIASGQQPTPECISIARCLDEARASSSSIYGPPARISVIRDARCETHRCVQI
jgi:hypothetical protein